MTNTTIVPLTKVDRIRGFESIGFKVSNDNILNAIGDIEVLLFEMKKVLHELKAKDGNQEILDAELVEHAKTLCKSVTDGFFAAWEIRSRLEIPYYQDHREANKRWLMEKIEKEVDIALDLEPAYLTTLGTMQFTNGPLKRPASNEQS